MFFTKLYNCLIVIKCSNNQLHLLGDFRPTVMELAEVVEDRDVVHRQTGLVHQQRDPPVSHRQSPGVNKEKRYMKIEVGKMDQFYSAI